jgi:homotetrameric cytidine deaminase
MPNDVFDTLRRLADDVSSHAYTPYSNQPVGVVALLADGTWVPGVRVENASFPLVIPALTAAYSAARCAGRDDLVAVVQNRPVRESDALFLSEALGSSWKMAEPAKTPTPPAAGSPLGKGAVLVQKGVDELPTPSNRLDVYLEAAPKANDDEMLRLAERVAQRAHIPESGFPVGCVVTAKDGSLIPGCNVEHADWTRGLCAERIALATARAYGHRSFLRIHLSCPHEPKPASCGACRQVMFELAAGVPVVMARGTEAPKIMTPEQLLPGGFRGDALRS